MLKNYFKVALRSIIKNKLTAFINIAGLALAMTCSILILLFIRDELSYDHYHSKADRIYRVTRNFLSPDGSVNLHLGHVAPPFGPLLKNDFPEFEQVVRTLQNTALISYEENAEQKKSFNEKNLFFAEPEIFEVFDIAVIKGNAEKSLADPFHMMLSAKTAKKYFGDEEAVGKSLRVGNQFEVAVSGIFQDFPPQSHWHPEVFLSFSTLNDSTIYGRTRLESNWGNNSFSTYILVKEPFDRKKTESQFPAFLDKHMGIGESTPNARMPSTWTTLFLQKITDIHLHSQLDSEIESNGNINNVHMMSVIGLFITLIACFNFINLSTARATKRAKEVGLRKVAGAFRSQLVAQYLSESVLVALFALILSFGFSFLSLQWLNDFTGKALIMNFWNDQLLFIFLVVFALLLGIFAGIYPAFVISSFKTVSILKGQPGSAKEKGVLRKALVVTQFAISIILIIATLITFQQLQFMNDRELGYKKDQIITLPYFREMVPSYDAFYHALLQQTSIRNATRSSRTPTGRLLDSQGTAQLQKGDSLTNTDVVLKNIRVDEEFFDTYGISFVAGRSFDKAIKTDDSLAFILNEAAVKMMGVSADEILTRDFKYAGVRGRVIGVVKDFHFESLHEPIVPLVFHPGSFSTISIQVEGNNMQHAINNIERIWKEFIPYRPFEYKFLSMQYAQLYASEKKQGRLFIVFSSLAIFIAGLGLFGLATFNTLQRLKEIGIRKVLGASVTSIVRLLSTEIIILILLANLLAWPAAWYFTDRWLSTFAYRISPGFSLYMAGAIAAICMGVLTVSTQTFKAALSNPSDTLRHD
jgi:putative ABC transport system permease protein